MAFVCQTTGPDCWGCVCGMIKIKLDRTKDQTGTVSDCPVGGCVCVKIKLDRTTGTVSDCPVGGCVCVKINLDRTRYRVRVSRRGLSLCKDQTGPYYRYSVPLSCKGLRLCKVTGPSYSTVSDCPVGVCVCVKIKLDRTTGTVCPTGPSQCRGAAFVAFV